MEAHPNNPCLAIEAGALCGYGERWRREVSSQRQLDLGSQFLPHLLPEVLFSWHHRRACWACSSMKTSLCVNIPSPGLSSLETCWPGMACLVMWVDLGKSCSVKNCAKGNTLSLLPAHKAHTLVCQVWLLWAWNTCPVSTGFRMLWGSGEPSVWCSVQLSMGSGRWSTAVSAKLWQGIGSSCDALVQVCLHSVLPSCFTHSALGMDPDGCSFPRKEKLAHDWHRGRAGICVSQWPGCIWRALDQVSAYICIHIHTRSVLMQKPSWNGFIC